VLSEPPPIVWIIFGDPDGRQNRAAAARQLGVISVPLESAGLALDSLTCGKGLIPDLILFDDADEEMPPAQFAAALTQALNGLAPPVVYIVSSREAADGLTSAPLRPGQDVVLRRPVLARDVIRAAFEVFGRSAEDRPVLQACGLELDLLKRTLASQGRNVHLTRFECRFMEYLMRRKDRVVTSDELLEHVWGFEPGTGSCEVLRAHVRNLRRKLEFLGASRDTIWTLPGRGYQLRPDPAISP
jgi:DNA-binding response OmpR family regulator